MLPSLRSPPKKREQISKDYFMLSHPGEHQTPSLHSIGTSLEEMGLHHHRHSSPKKTGNYHAIIPTISLSAFSDPSDGLFSVSKSPNNSSSSSGSSSVNHEALLASSESEPDWIDEPRRPTLKRHPTRAELRATLRTPPGAYKKIGTFLFFSFLLLLLFTPPLLVRPAPHPYKTTPKSHRPVLRTRHRHVI